MENLKYSEILKESVLLAEGVKYLTPYKITVLSNITCNQFLDILTFNLRKSHLNPVMHLGNYDNIVQDSYSCGGSQLVIIHYDLMGIVGKSMSFVENCSKEDCDALIEGVQSEIDLILSNLHQIPAVVFNLFASCGLYTNALLTTRMKFISERLNEYLRKQKRSNLYLLDIDTTLMKVGMTNAFEYRMYYLSKTLYTIAFWKEYTHELSTLIYKLTGKIKKAIIFDCDNTLWRGVLGEDGEDGIDMSGHSSIGQIYHQVQQIAVWLGNQGGIVGLCSKNNAEDVDRILVGHADQVLKLENIVIRRVNWQDKATNLREIAKELNIGLESIVFVDDSSFEIDWIRTQLPEVLTFQVPSAIHEYPIKLLQLIERFFYLEGSPSDLEKTRQYKVQIQRNEEKEKYDSLEIYLTSLRIELVIKKDDMSQTARIAQLTQKTNQFNVTTHRYTEGQIEQFMKDDSLRVYSCEVKDKFGENGLTAVCIIRENGEEALIDSFLMSCRIMGRNIEYAIMNYLIALYKAKRFTVLMANYIPTTKNIPVSEFFETVGFELMVQKEIDKAYKLTLKDYKKHHVEYIKIKE